MYGSAVVKPVRKWSNDFGFDFVVTQSSLRLLFGISMERGGCTRLTASLAPLSKLNPVCNKKPIQSWNAYQQPIIYMNDIKAPMSHSHGIVSSQFFTRSWKHEHLLFT